MRRAVAVVLLLAAACSGGDGLTRAQFIHRGDAICQGFARVGDALTRPGSVDELVAGLDRVIDEATEGRAAFARLDPPRGGERVRRAMLAFLDSTITNGRKAQAAVVDRDMAAASTAIGAITKDALAAQRAAEAYGFETCAGGSLQP